MIEVSKLAPQELRNYLKNAHRKGRTDIVRAVLAEMDKRGIAKPDDYQMIPWNQDRVRTVMEPFKEMAEMIPGNQRTVYTEAGGLKIGLPKTDPERMWIDTYCAIKASNVNAVLVCYITSGG
jgi:hypothetical protein